MNCARRSGRPGGFTLIEVMVALAVVAVALPALLFALMQQIDGSAYLRDRTVASWIAANTLAELRLVAARQGRLPTGDLTGETRMANRDWYWRVERETTDIQGFERIEIDVALEPGVDTTSLFTLSAFLTPEDDVSAP